MRVLVTGSTGFVGRWMVRELETTGHRLAAPADVRVEITDDRAVADLVATSRPEGVIHLAGVAFGPDATADPDRANRVNVGGTEALLRAIAELEEPPSVVVSGSSDVYGAPDPADLPLAETAPLRPTSAYGRSKLGQERAALAATEAGRTPIAVTRSFNHTGPGQRATFVAPALARRVLAARQTGVPEIPVGNIDVRRDFADVRDVVRAYRLILEGLAAGAIPSGSVLNVATGSSIAIRDLVSIIAEIVGVAVRPEPDPSLIRANDPPDIVGDPTRLATLTGWRPSIPIDRTLADLVATVQADGP